MKFKKFKKIIRKLETQLPDDIKDKVPKEVLREVPKEHRNIFIKAVFNTINSIKAVYEKEEKENNINVNNEPQDEFLNLSIEICPECKKMTIKK